MRDRRSRWHWPPRNNDRAAQDGVLLVAAWPIAVVGVAFIVASAALGFTALGGRVAMQRQRRMDDGQIDLLQQLNASRDEAAVACGTVPPAGAPRHLAARSWLGRNLP
jgi:hypothetical protein